MRSMSELTTNHRGGELAAADAANTSLAHQTSNALLAKSGCHWPATRHNARRPVRAFSGRVDPHKRSISTPLSLARCDRACFNHEHCPQSRRPSLGTAWSFVRVGQVSVEMVPQLSVQQRFSIIGVSFRGHHQVSFALLATGGARRRAAEGLARSWLR